MTAQSKPEPLRSLPWSRAEFVLIDGLPCVYSLGDGGCIVHLPGCHDRPLAELRVDGHAIDGPRQWRADSIKLRGKVRDA